jgi:hypothetical protein
MGTPDQTNVDPIEEVPLWCVAANIVASGSDSPGKTVAPNGTKHFKPGAKVYAIDWATGTSEELVVIGHHRKSRQFLKAVVSVACVEQPHVEQIALPTVTTLVQKHVASGGAALTREHADALLQAIVARQAG